MLPMTKLLSVPTSASASDNLCIWSPDNSVTNMKFWYEYDTNEYSWRKIFEYPNIRHTMFSTFCLPECSFSDCRWWQLVVELHTRKHYQRHLESAAEQGRKCAKRKSLQNCTELYFVQNTRGTSCFMGFMPPSVCKFAPNTIWHKIFSPQKASFMQWEIPKKQKQNIFNAT